MDNMNDDHITF